MDDSASYLFVWVRQRQQAVMAIVNVTVTERVIGTAIVVSVPSENKCQKPCKQCANGNG